MPTDVEGRVKRAARLWSPIVEEKLEDGTLLPGHRIPVTCGSDATPVPAHPQYCFHRNCVIGVCGLCSPGHKCSLATPETISSDEEGYNQIITLIRTNVWGSYVYVHILQPQVDWLPPVHAHIFVTCNSYDHTPHLESMWTKIRAEFAKTMANLPLMLTGKGADGDPKERTMFLQLMYSRWRDRHHPRLSTFSERLLRTSKWLWLEGWSRAYLFFSSLYC